MIDTSDGVPRCDICGSYNVKWLDCKLCGASGLGYPGHCEACDGNGGRHVCCNWTDRNHRENLPEESREDGRHDSGTL